MKSIFKTIPLFMTLLLSLGLVGCGGGGGSSVDSDTSTKTLSGLTAVGAPLSNAQIVIKGRAGLEATGQANAAGNFSIDITDLTAPYILKATSSDPSLVLYSYARSGATNANITPITTIIVSRSLESGSTLQALFSGFGDLNLNVFETNFRAAIEQMNDAIGNSDFSDFNHFSGVFAANGTEYDGILDSLNFSYQNGAIVIKNSDNVIMIGTNDTDAILGEDNNKYTNITGKIVDGSTNLPIEGAMVTITLDGSDTPIVASTGTNGIFEVEVPKFNTITVTVSGEGYQETIIENVDSTSAASEISLAKIPSTPSTEVNPVTFKGKILDSATENAGVAMVTVLVRSGINNQTGGILDQTESDTNGNFTIADIDAGNYTLELVKDGYYSSFENVYIDSSNQADTTNLYVHTDINATESGTDAGTDNGDAGTNDSDTGTDTNTAEPDPITSLTIILTWDSLPEDLDAHLTGPKAGIESERFHVQVLTEEDKCWADTNLDSNASCESNETATAYLERDDIDGFGPETITVRTLTSGEYKFYVHHANFLFTSEGSISGTSNAQVKVIDSNGEIYTFNAPISGGEGSNDIWHVFTTTANGKPLSVNTIEANNSDVTSSLN